MALIQFFNYSQPYNQNYYSPPPYLNFVPSYYPKQEHPNKNIPEKIYNKKPYSIAKYKKSDIAQIQICKSNNFINNNLKSFSKTNIYSSKTYNILTKSKTYKLLNDNSKESNNINIHSGDTFSMIKNKIDSLENEIKKEKLYINLIFFDENILNRENKNLYNEFQLNVVGAFFGIQDINTFENLLNKIEEKNLPFILIFSGLSYQKISSLCIKMKLIKNIVISCMNKEKYSILYQDNQK